MIDKSHRWKKTALAAATAIFCLWGSNAAALSLGRITVQSALGEPLRAEVDIPEINADEAASLKATVASPEAFRAAGLEYNPAMSTLQVSLQRRSDGRAFIRISGDKAINDPFVDMILEARWASGRIVRDYTLLFDPPRTRQAEPSTPTPAQTTPLVVTTRPAAPQVTAQAARPARAPEQDAAPNLARKPAAVANDNKPANAVKAVVISRGDTAGKIAADIKPVNISLDQMLVAMLRTNPDAFIGDNINRIKAGAVLSVPTEEQASATDAGEATRIIVAQSKDFNEFRRKLADSAPGTAVVAADRQASGSVQTKVEDKKPVATTPDKLTLSKGALQSKAAEDQLAAQRNAQEAANRAAEISRNLSELSQLNAASSAVAPATTASQAAATPPAPPASTAVAAAPVLPVSTPVIASAAPASAPAPAPVPPKPAASAPPPPPAAAPEPSLLDGLIEDPLVPAGALGLIALLAGLGVYRMRQRKKATQVDSAFQESHLRQDSFFGVSGGQSIDTNDNLATGSSMMYSPSQLDAVDDVDPVAEADVYLAYGRDIQAEEILKDALLTNPGRLAIHHKLLEIYAKRRDTQAFESIARKAFKAASGDALEWQRICELGLSIDPGNPLYQAGGEPGHTEPGASRQSPLDDGGSALQSAAGLAAVAPAVGAVDLDLDLDFSMDDEPVPALGTETPGNAVPDLAEPEPEALDLDFGMKTEVFERPAVAPVDSHSNAMEFTLPDLDIPELSMGSEALKPQPAADPALTPGAEPQATATQDSDMGMLEFDLESLSLDLDSASGPITEAGPEAEAHEDPLATKLALAEEFRAIGDDDGARALIDEVIAEATGDMKVKAQRALSNL